MKWIGIAVVLALAGRTPVHAQSVTRATLLGSWARDGETEPKFTFRDDSTVSVAFGRRMMQGGKLVQDAGVATGRWQLLGDTLVLQGLKGDIGGRQIPVTLDRRVVTLEGQKLRLTKVEGGRESGPAARVYEHVDSALAPASSMAKPKP